MKKMLLMSAVMGVLLVSLSANAITVEPRGFTLCTSINASSICTAGVFWGIPSSYHVPGAGDVYLEQSESIEDPDWGDTYAERWEPRGVTSFDDSVGLNWTCCMDYNPATEDPTTFSSTFQYWEFANGGSWVNAAWKGFIGYDDDLGKWCGDMDADYVYQGRQDTGGSGNSSPTWDYGTSPNDRVARCKGQIKISGTNDWVWKGIEYWME